MAKRKNQNPDGPKQKKQKVGGKKSGGTKSGRPRKLTNKPCGGRYKKLEKIGEGSYGTVYKAQNLDTEKIVAIKVTKLDFHEGVPYSTVRETSILRSLKHPAIIELLAVQCKLKPKKALNLFFEFCETDLQKYLEGYYSSQTFLPIQEIKKLSYQLFSGILYLHKRGLFHRDLKPVNILLDGNQNLKIADFGLGREFSIPIRALTPKVVTLCYRCPEILLGTEVYGGGVDVWSCGCIVAELFITDMIFDGDCEFGQLMKIFQIMGTPAPDIWDGVDDLPHYCEKWPKWKPKDLHEKIPHLTNDAQDLISKCLAINPKDRFTALQAEEHPFFDDIRDTAFDTC